jgi:hypothetical protein
MSQVEALEIKAEQQEQKVTALEQALTSYRNAHPTLTLEALEADPDYRAQSLHFTAEERVLKELINRMRDMTMM